MDRRTMLKTTGGVALGSILGGITIPSYGKESPKEKVNAENRKKILVVGAHPDDPETGAGGTFIYMILVQSVFV